MVTLLTQLDVHLRSIIVGPQPRRDQGAGIVEYVLLVTLIALVIVVALAFFTGELSAGFSRAGSSLPT